MDGPKIIIIGAGLAGISAAQRLIKQSLTNIQIIEAKNRIGGRVHTEKYNQLDSHVEFGAQWIHGQGSNPIYQLAQKNGLLETEEEEDDEYTFYTQKGRKVPDEIVKETCDVLEDILDDANKFSRKNITLTCEDDSIGTYAKQAFAKYMRVQKDSTRVAEIKEAIFNWQMLIQKTENGCQTPDELSLYSWGQYLEYEGHEAVVLKHGYDPILRLISSDIPERCFHLRAEVRTIELNQQYSNNLTRDVNYDSGSNLDQCEPLTITLANGDILTSDYVIFTGSLGVLKAHAHSMFLPSLPDDKLAVIERMGFGTVNKIYLEFENPFWDKDIDGIQLLWLPDSKPLLLKSLGDKHIEEYGEWYKSIHGFDVVDHHTNLLCGWIAGDDAKIMEKIPDDVIMNVCTELLRMFTGSDDVSLPSRIIRTQWSSEPHILGSYSYIKAGQTADDCDILAYPLPDPGNPRLLFAGEATDRTYFSTTHAALLSGQREADRIIKHYSNQN